MENNKNQENQSDNPVSGTQSVEPSVTKPSVNPAANPYYDQQVLPGQVIGYGVPTDQQVFGKPASGLKKKSNKVLILVSVAILILLSVAIAAVLLLS